jgi:hypothetical protein
VEKPFLISALAFLLEMASFLLGCARMFRDRRGLRGGESLSPGVLTTVTAVSGVLVLFFALAFGGPYRISDIHPAVATALLLAVLMPFTQLIFYRRWYQRRDRMK